MASMICSAYADRVRATGGRPGRRPPGPRRVRDTAGPARPVWPRHLVPPTDPGSRRGRRRRPSNSQASARMTAPARRAITPVPRRHRVADPQAAHQLGRLLVPAEARHDVGPGDERVDLLEERRASARARPRRRGRRRSRRASRVASGIVMPGHLVVEELGVPACSGAAGRRAAPAAGTRAGRSGGAPRRSIASTCARS